MTTDPEPERAFGPLTSPEELARIRALVLAATPPPRRRLSTEAKMFAAFVAFVLVLGVFVHHAQAATWTTVKTPTIYTATPTAPADYRPGYGPNPVGCAALGSYLSMNYPALKYWDQQGFPARYSTPEGQALTRKQLAFSALWAASAWPSGCMSYDCNAGCKSAYTAAKGYYEWNAGWVWVNVAAEFQAQTGLVLAWTLKTTQPGTCSGTYRSYVYLGTTYCI